MFTLQTTFKTLLLGEGGREVKSVIRGDFEFNSEAFWSNYVQEFDLQLDLNQCLLSLPQPKCDIVRTDPITLLGTAFIFYLSSVTTVCVSLGNCVFISYTAFILENVFSKTYRIHIVYRP